MKSLLAWLGTVNKAWVGGVVTFVATFVVQQFFGVHLDVGTTDLLTNIVWQVLVALGVAAPAVAAVYTVPNKPTVASVQKDAAKVGLLVDYPSIAASPYPGGTELVGETAEQLK